jgi:uncharacterized protein YebE (UPF0316 family)
MMMEFDWYSLVVLPILVFIARFVDVTLGTMRIIFTSRGRRNLAPVLGFIEVFIWIAMVGQIVKSANSINAYFGYAAGFALGTFVGMLLEERMAMGTLVVRVILNKRAQELTEALRAAGFGVTSVQGEGAQGAVTLLYTVVQRKNLEAVTRIVHETCPGAFFSVEEVRMAERGIFPVRPVSIADKR